MQPLVSIIIPTYNRAHLLGETLDSVLAQTYKNWECIVVDDDSNDATEELMEFYCERDTRIQYYQRPKDRKKGANACRNYGFNKSKGKFIQWYDSDDILHPQYLEKKISVKTIKSDLIISDTAVVGETNTSILKIFCNETNSERLLIDYATWKVNLNLQAALWSINIVKKYKFDEFLHRGQELEFHFRILSNENVKVFYVNEVLSFIRSHKESISGKFESGSLESIKSELFVRKGIINYFADKGLNQNEKQLILKPVMRTFRLLYKNYSIKFFLNEIKKFNDNDETNFNFILNNWKLILWYYISKLTGRNFRFKYYLDEYLLKFL